MLLVAVADGTICLRCIHPARFWTTAPVPVSSALPCSAVCCTVLVLQPVLLAQTAPVCVFEMSGL